MRVVCEHSLRKAQLKTGQVLDNCPHNRCWELSGAHVTTSNMSYMATWVTVLEIPCEVQTQEVTHVKDIWNNLSVQKKEIKNA